MSDICVDTLLTHALKSDEVPPPALVREAKLLVENIGYSQEARKTRRMNKTTRSLLIAALIILFVATTAFTTMYVIHLRSVRELHIPGGPETLEFGLPDGTIDEMPTAIISLQGFAGSPEHSAAARWISFIETYDPDGAILAEIGDTLGLPPEYIEYVRHGAYTMEMVEEIRAILDYYGLSLLGDAIDFHTAESLYLIAYNSFMDSTFVSGWGLYYTSGAFQLDVWTYTGGFQIRLTPKGFFDTVYMNVGDIEAFTEWKFENIHGTELLLALGRNDNMSLIIYDREDAFITVNVGFETKDELENFANMIDFTQLR